MTFNKYAKIKAIANLCAAIFLLGVMFFAYRRIFFDIMNIDLTPESDEGSVMLIGVGVILFFGYFFLSTTPLVGLILSVVSAFMLFSTSGFLKKQKRALRVGRIGKFFAVGSCALLALAATTLLSKIVYFICTVLFLSSAILDIIFTILLSENTISTNA